ncbi:WYL domain-containing protein [Herbidospora sp. NEAU-GS84]|uniref:WYL domain-containing protein n=1 Tax=Herbidospora solisilvae TaxID=2696284 RepID=A0A7C9NZ65_9ACTN|nr:WYL domain-containing protein [Herbidospora solisilvae]NAS21457.1 WYL domain-containing protein [Herbidospora solisilvae]
MITYVAGNGDWTTRVIEPHAISYSDAGHAGVRAYDRLRSAIRAFRVDRIDP